MLHLWTRPPFSRTVRLLLYPIRRPASAHHISHLLNLAPANRISGAAVPFKGLLKRTKTSDLAPDAFFKLAPGASTESIFDLAAVTDLRAGGPFEVIAEGALAVADGSSLSSSKVTYRSNTLSINVDGTYAAKVAPAIKPLDTRTIETSCSGANDVSLDNALSRCVTLSTNAANAAASGSAAKFQEYFKTTDQGVRNTVAARLRGVANQARSTTSGTTRYYCTDPYGYCDPNVLAYSKSLLPHTTLHPLTSLPHHSAPRL